MSHPSLAANAQSPNPGEIVALFRLDATSIGGGVYYFCQAAYETKGVTFGGVYYTPVDVEFTDFDISGTGSLPTPKMKVANTNEVFQGMVNTYGDMLGCVVQRVRTFRKFLDGQPQADPTAYYGPDTFRVERKVNENAVFIEWELSASIDQEGKRLPGRVVVRDTCMWRYRTWNEATRTFDYKNVTCPYTGSACFDRAGRATTPDKDSCGRRISDCEKRFGRGNPLPFGGFPGVARVRL